MDLAEHHPALGARGDLWCQEDVELCTGALLNHLNEKVLIATDGGRQRLMSACSGSCLP